LESFESPAGVFKEKVNLFKYIDNKGLAAINADDVFLSRVERGDFYKSVSFSISQEADVYAKSFLFSGDGTSFKLYCGSESIDIKIPQLGTFFIQDAVCAAALAFGLGFSLEEIEAGLSNYNPPKMRMETIILPSGAIFINDAYNANPSSMKESIRTVCETYPQKEINLVLGDMLELGSKSAYYHKELGAFADRFKLKSVYLIGAEMLAAKDEFKYCEARYFDDSGKLLDSLERANFNSKNAVFLFKSSRAVQLEKIVDCLIKGHSAAQTEFKF
ncbi:MAG: UDP-N-acetylmuramoyl-tripeptide--D-alanyl-D-alanine ligase, partial [Elusimicrobiota bacterium]|nr:UDP-N-acetylmuramoyl-tripeptide--D-alanyl-D-alanine ligase [Elusimicrobiota bacterium]